MKKHITSAGMLRMLTAVFLLFTVMAVSSGCKKGNTPKALKDFSQVNLVANNNEYGAAHIDPLLLNAWGLAFSSGGTPWVSSQLGHVSVVYDKEGAIVRPAVNIPSPGGPTGGNPTGVVFSGSATDFKLSNGQPARFIFVGVDGILSGWNGAAGNNALLVKNNSATSAYTGLTLASNAGANYLYAADFRAGKIAVWDNTFAPVSMSFKDPHLPSGYSPFNIQIVGSWLYVLYAKVGPDGEDQAGAGNGYVSIFTTAGAFVKRFTSRGTLNSPWGIAATPAGFFDDMDGDKDDGKSKASIPESVLLVGNLGDGRINVYSEGGDFIGQLKSHGRTIVIDGLWALSFPPVTATTIDPNRLYFTAGPDDETHGLFGYIIKN
jgi:uncharacterized protein (TIGR03118 family)